MKTVLSIQSHVAYGHAGNRAAVFPLELMGYEVIAVNTVQFSNHAGYESFTGQVFDVRHIEDILAGIEERGVFPSIAAVLSGYMGSAGPGHVVLHTVNKIRKASPDVLYLCDPVMGDEGKGFYVDKKLQKFFKEKAVAAADIITPNRFELEYLSGQAINTMEDARMACSRVHQAGPSVILLTSLEVKETKEGEIQMLASCKDGKQWLVGTPKFDLDPAPNGAGDLTAALFLGRLLAGEPPEKALQNAAAGVYGVFEKTKWLNRRELALIPAQDCLKADTPPFKAAAL